MADPNKMGVDEGMEKFAAPAQAKYLKAYLRLGTIRKVAAECGVDGAAVGRSLLALKKKAAMSGHAPDHGMVHDVPEPFVVRGTSTLYDEDGKKKLQWVKTRLDDQKVEQLIRDFVASLIEDARGTSKLVKPPAFANEDLLAVYPIGDPHFGMYSWAAETVNDFDANIAERITTGAVDRLMTSAPAAHTGLVIPLGDLLHADDSTNRTPQHGYVLDVDTRHQRVMVIALRVVKHTIYRALEQHQKVIVRIVGGNHDPHASFAIALALSEHFDNNPRVHVDLSPAAHWYYRFGKVLLGVTHGDTTKMNALPGVMAADRSQEWGETEFRYWYCGHIHHVEVREFPGVILEYFRTLAAKDSWHASRGYRAGRDMQCIVHHRLYGEIERHRCDVAMIT